MLTAVVFDLDNTLVDERSAARRAVTAWAAALGVGGPEAAGHWARVSAKHYARYQRRELSFVQQRRERVREFLGAAVADAEADRLFAGYLEHYEAGWAAFDDAVPTLRRARAAGLAVAVLTNGEDSQQRRKLERLNLWAEMDVFVSSSTLPAGKPDARAFRHTVERLGAEPAEVLMVGDSMTDDVLGARAAGLAAVLLDRAGAGGGVRSLHELGFA